MLPLCDNVKSKVVKLSENLNVLRLCSRYADLAVRVSMLSAPI